MSKKLSASPLFTLDLRPVNQQGGNGTGGNSADARTIFLVAIALGVLLRLVAIIWGDIGVGDGMGRMIYAVQWSEHPRWQGLSGVWPRLHWYVLGLLLRLYNNPILLAKLLNFPLGIATLFVFRAALVPLFGEFVASLSALQLAVCWPHIWVTTGYRVEIPFLLLVFLAVRYALASSPASLQSSILSGLFLAVAVLLRHEALLLVGVFLLWYSLQVKDARRIVGFAVLPLAAFSWHFLEPRWYGHSYFEYVWWVKQMKWAENLTQGFTFKQCLYHWILVPAAVPSVFVVLPGFYGLWKSRCWILRDLFALMFLIQGGFLFFMTLASGWRPNLRYLMLCFVNLCPYAALTWSQWAQRYPPRYVLPGLIAATMVTQAMGWWIGINYRRPWGWLPMQIRTSSQQALDQWVAELHEERLTDLRIVTIGPASLAEQWSLGHSLLVHGISPSAIQAEGLFAVGEAQAADRSLPVGVYTPHRLPRSIFTADAILMDPQAPYYSAVLDLIKKKRPSLEMRPIHARLTVLLLADRLRSHTSLGEGHPLISPLPR